jgi:hypothetical protein
MVLLSHILFGDFSTCHFNASVVNKIKTYARQKDIYFYFEGGDDLFEDVLLMLEEHNKDGVAFYVTSKLQPQNSDDLLEPFDKYEQEELFPNGDDRTVFEAKCKENLDLLYDVLKTFFRLLKPKKWRIFVTVDYDTEFTIKKCTIETMMTDILDQVCNTIEVDSTIFEIIQE